MTAEYAVNGDGLPLATPLCAPSLTGELCRDAPEREPVAAKVDDALHRCALVVDVLYDKATLDVAVLGAAPAEPGGPEADALSLEMR